MKYIFLLLFLISSNSYADTFASCNTLFYKIPIYKIANTTELCNDEYAVLYSNIYKVPLFTYEKIEIDNTIPRKSTFKTDYRIDKNYRSYTIDYTNSGYDRGHMAPSSDMTSIESQQQSFLMSNIVPQSPKNNQVQWRQLEEKIRLLNYKTKYIITGTIFTNELYIKNNIRVPSQLYKIVYVNKCYYAWIIDNKDNAVVKTITLQTIYKKTGIKYKLSNKKCV